MREEWLIFIDSHYKRRASKLQEEFVNILTKCFGRKKFRSLRKTFAGETGREQKVNFFTKCLRIFGAGSDADLSHGEQFFFHAELV